MTKQIRKNLVHPGVRNGSGSKAINHAGASQIGARQGNHFTNGGADGRMESRYGGVDLYSTGPGYNKAPYGNEVAKNTVCGVGGSRTIYKTGSQGQRGDGGAGLNPQDPMAGWKR
jgi:hypothetical protein